MFRHSERVTVRSDEELYGIATDHLQNWIDPIRALAKKYPLRNWGMVGYTFGELFADMMLAVFSMVGGAYFNAARTMRSVFEYMVHASYVNQEFPSYPGLVYDTMQEETADEEFGGRVRERLRTEFGFCDTELDQLTGFKSRMIYNLKFLTPEERACLHRTYSQLSELVHPSPLQLKKYTGDAFLGVTFFYDRNLFRKCVRLMDAVMDLVLSVLLISFPEIATDLKSQKYAYESLARLPMTSRLIKDS